MPRLFPWMGEFGRTAKINNNVGRDHQWKAFTIARTGAGIKKGFVPGSTSEHGTAITKQPVTVADLFYTFCQALQIDARKENDTPIGRPIKIVEGGEPVKELFA